MTNAGHLIEPADPSFILSDSTDCSTECGQMNLSFTLFVQQRRQTNGLRAVDYIKCYPVAQFWSKIILK